MKDRAILFSGPMVRALRAGKKTQTRRVAKVPANATDVRYWAPPSGRSQPGWANPGLNYWTPDPGRATLSNHLDECPYGQPGDRLVVRETFFAFGRWETRFNAKKGRDEWHFVDLTLESGRSYLYDADHPRPQPLAGKRDGGVTPKWWKRPAIFMPRAACRILLDVFDVRVERLQDISEADCRAEGITDGGCTTCGMPEPCGCAAPAPDAREAYCHLWQQINGAESWAANPWVWVVTFEVLP